jgi:transcriptional regulator with XRE-family HTH domain
MKKILDTIKAHRAIRGFSQEYMANMLGIDYSTYGKIENGSSSLKVERWIAIAKILEIDLYAFFRNENQHEIKPNQKKEGKVIIEFPIDPDSESIQNIMQHLGLKIELKKA